MPKIKKEFDVNSVTKDLFVNINDRERLVGTHNGKMYLNNRELTDVQVAEIIEHAKILKSMDTFEILLREIEAVACERIYYQGGEDTEMLKHGKSMLYTVDVLRKKIDNLVRMKK